MGLFHMRQSSFLPKIVFIEEYIFNRSRKVIVYDLNEKIFSLGRH